MEIGTESHRYAVVDRWGLFPGALEIGTAHAIVEDQRGRIFVHHTGRAAGG